MRRLPPLGALRAFEAAARHLSFTRAAAELCVTQAAISHQVRQLEDWLGMRLFARKGHALTLTSGGGSYLTELTQLFDGLAEATARLHGRPQNTLRITALPSFASRWLLPRLGDFRTRYPDIELKLTAAATLWSHTDDSFDIGIRSGLGRWPGFKADLIAREFLSPLCSPVLSAQLTEPADLRDVTLLHDEPKGAWRTWFEYAGVTPPRRASGVVFNDAGMVLQAAVEGQGVALGRLMLAAEDLAAGRLEQPFELTVPNDYSYWLAYPRASAGRPEVAAFRAWLLEQARAWR